jgi:hypothetical protein
MKMSHLKSFLLLAVVAIVPFHAHADENRFECRFLQTPGNSIHDKNAHYVYGNGASIKWAAKTAISSCEMNGNWMFLLGGGARACDAYAVSDVPQNRLSCALVSDLATESNVDKAFAKYGHPFIGNADDLQALLNEKDPNSDPSVSTNQVKADDPSQFPSSFGAPTPSTGRVKGAK